MASHDQNCAHCRLSVAKLAITKTTTPNTSQQALQRASNSLGGSLWVSLAARRGASGGCAGCIGYQPKALRSAELMRSASHTRAMKTSKMLATSEPLNIFIDESIN